MKNNPLFLTLLVLIAVSLPAQPWQAIEGRYARVEYQTEHAALADSLLKIAEEALPRLSALFDLPVTDLAKRKVRIILTDSPDISNGYALADAVVIYALSSMYMSNWSGPGLWYEKVLRHELAHTLTFRKIGRKLNILGQLPNLTVPRWFFEGIAQYYTEDWNIYRGDLYVRHALLNGTLTYSTLENLEDGQLLYATAHAFVRYLADQFGDSSLVHLMDYNRKGWYLDFEEAFETVYGKSAAVIFAGFIRHMVLYYGDMLAEYPVSAMHQNLPSFGYRTLQVLPLNAADSTYLVAVQSEKNHRFRSAQVVRIKNNRQKVIRTISNRLHTDLVLSGDKRYVAFGQHHLRMENDQTALSLSWHIFDLNSGNTQRIVSRVRAREAVFDPQNRLILVEVQPSGSVVNRYDWMAQSVTELFRTDMPVGRLACLSNGDVIFAAQRANGNRDLFLFSNDAITALTNDRQDNRNPVVIDDSLLVFNRYVDENPALAVLDPRRPSAQIRLNDQNAYWLQGYDAEGKQLILASLDVQRNPQFSLLAVDSLLGNEVKPAPFEPKARYSGWTTRIPQPIGLPIERDRLPHNPEKSIVRFPQKNLIHIFSLALPTYDAKLGLGIFGLTSWVEALQRQMLAASFILFQKDYQQSLALLTHGLVLFNSNWFSTYFHGPVIFSHQNGEYISLYQDIASLEWNRKYFIRGNDRLTFTPSLTYSGYYYQLQDQLTGIPDRFGFHGPALALRMSYWLPTSYYPALPKRLVELSFRYFKSFDRSHDFGVSQTDIKLATNLIREELGLQTRFTLINKHGPLPPLKVIGVDRFYDFDIPRDFKYTKPLRGVRQDFNGDALYWISTDLVYFVTKNSGYSILFLPINNLAVSAFWDAAMVPGAKKQTAMGYGAELSFGEDLYRLGLGYARARYPDHSRENSLLLRISLFLPMI